MSECICARTADWASKQFGEVFSGDARLDQRLVKVAAAMAAAPEHSLPNQYEHWSDIKAAYRLLNNEKVTPEVIQATHRRQTRELCSSHARVLAIEDSTELDYTRHRAVKGLGFLGGGLGRGLLQHSTLAVTTEGHPLGILHQIWWKRIRTAKGEKRRQRQARARESDLWPDSIRAIGAVGPHTRLIHVTDRGGDCFETMFAAYAVGQGFLIRARHNRQVNDSSEHLWKFMARQGVAGTRTIEIAARPAQGKQAAQPARTAQLAVRYAPIQFSAPRNDPRFKGQRLSAWAVFVVELDPPPDVEPVEWMLLTSEYVENIDQANACVDWYTYRWLIEEWHKAEKTGCRLEASQLKSAEALERLAALTAVVALRLLQLRELAHAATDPSVPAESVSAQPAALQSVVPHDWILVVSRLAKCSPETLTPRLFWSTLARRGGFIGRKRDGLPGWQTIWRGWKEIVLLIQGVEIQRALASEGTYG